jgi:hypothetical protein
MVGRHAQRSDPASSTDYYSQQDTNFQNKLIVGGHRPRQC